MTSTGAVQMHTGEVFRRLRDQERRKPFFFFAFSFSLLPFIYNGYIGAVVGNSVGTLLCQLLSDQLTSREKKKLKDYLKQLEILDSQLDQEYQTYIKQINDSLINYYNLLESAFSPDYRVAFDSSIALAKSIGISDDQILKNKQEIDDYFLRQM